MKVDAHQHFWHYTPEEYGWIDDSMAVIRRDFLPADLVPELDACGLDGTIAVQARQTLAETDWLLDLAQKHPRILGVVGWVPLRESRLPEILDRLAGNAALVGVRHVLQAEPDAFFEDDAFLSGLAEVERRGLTYGLLIYARQLPLALLLVDRFPNLRIVLDHIAKPVVQGPPPADWRRNLAELARRPRVFCKISGVVTEAPGFQWSESVVVPYLEETLTTFGPERLLFGSDWPVCLVATDYARWFHCVQDWSAKISPSERALLLGGNAASVYRIPHPSRSP